MTRRFVVAAILLATALAAAAPAAAGDLDRLTFRGIGPTLSGGRMTAIAGSVADPFLYYAGAAAGGLWKTTDGGATWTALFTQEPVAAIGAVAVWARDPKVVWIGTGEANPRNDVERGDGVWKSADGGKTFAHLGLDRTAQIARISLDPRDPKTALVAALGDPFADAADRGVYRTADGGVTWQKTLYSGPASGASDLARDPADPRVVYAGMWQFRRLPWTFSSGGAAGGLYRSRDGGITWTKLSGHGLPAAPTGRIGIAIAPSRPQRVYAEIESKDGILWRSDDGGATWRCVSADTIANQRPFYFSRLAVDPRDPDHVVALSVYAVESRDAGRTWKRIAPLSQYDYHDLWWAPDGRRMALALDAGLLFSHDGGANWARPTNMDVAQAYRIGYDTERLPYRVCAGLQDNDTWCGPSDSRNGVGVLERDWIDVQRGDGGFVWPDPADPDLIWGTTTNQVPGQVAVFDARAVQSVDVSPYPRDVGGMALAGVPYRFNWVTPLAPSPLEPAVAYVGANVVFRTADRGRTWTAISPDLTRDDKTRQQASGGPIERDVSGAEFYGTILDVAPSPLQKGVLWASTDDGRVQVTQDGGAHWRDATPPALPRDARVETVEAGRFQPGIAYVAADRHMLGDRAPYLFATADYGATWRSIAANLPHDQYAHVVRQDPRNGDVLYAGLSTSLWFSLDGGSRWEPLRANLPAAPVYDLGIPPQANDLVVGTHGRSIWILDDLGPIEQLAAARERRRYLFEPRTSYAYYAYPLVIVGTGNAVDANAFVGPNPDTAYISYYLERPAAAPLAVEIADASGRTVRRFSGTDDDGKPLVPNEAGVNRLSWDGMEDPPVKWRSARPWNRGPGDGAEALPGRYTVRLRVDEATLTREFDLRADPRSPWTPEQLQQRHAFLAGLLDELSQIDIALNDLDADAARRAQARSVEAGFTSFPVNSEDGLKRPDGVRERLIVLLSYLDTSLQPPTAAQRDEARAIAAQFDAAMTAYRAFRRR